MEKPSISLTHMDTKIYEGTTKSQPFTEAFNKPGELPMRKKTEEAQ